MANLISALKRLLIGNKISKVWFMEPIASLLHEKILFIVFKWKSQDALKYALNVRDASESIELASEMVNPISVEANVIEIACAESKREGLSDSDTQANIVCHILGTVDLKSAFKKRGIEVPSAITNLFSNAIALDEKDQLNRELLPPVENLAVNIRNPRI